MTQTDWHRLIDTSFDGGPEVTATPHEDLLLGHRALRRRRVRVAGFAGGAVLMTTLLASAVVTLPGEPAAPTRAGGADSSATAPDSPAVDDPAPLQRPAQTREVYRSAVGPLYLDRETGDLDLPDGWKELDRVVDPIGAGSLAVEITDGDDTFYLISTTEEGDRGALYLARPDGGSTLQEYVDAFRADNRGSLGEGRG